MKNSVGFLLGGNILKGNIKKFFEEFKKFITRGNVVDMAVGVIIGSAFTGVVNGLSNYVLKPIINWLLSLVVGGDALESVYTFLVKATVDGAIDLENSIYIDWGALINAIINFFLIAVVLFTIIKVMNKVKENNEKIQEEIRKNKITKEDRKILKERGIKLSNVDAVKAYLEERENLRLAEIEKAKKEAEEKAIKERLENPTVEDLLKDIKVLLQEKTN